MGTPPGYERFPAGTQDKGISTFEPDVSADVTWDESTVNVTSGIRRGVQPRYGMAPLAGHADTEVTSGSRTNGLMASEATATGQGLLSRELIFGIVPINMASYDGAWPKANRRFYAYLVGLDDTSNVSLDVCLGSTLATTIYKQSADIRAGLMASSYKGESPLVRRHKTELLNLPTATTAVAADVAAVLRAVGSRYWTPYAHFQITGKRIPYFNMVGDTTSTPAITTAPNVCLWQFGTTTPTLTHFGGAPSEIITREFVANQDRTITVYCYDTTGQPIDMNYTVPITAANTAAVQEYSTDPHYLSLTGATKNGASTSYASVAMAMVNDPASFTNSRHDAILIAGETPIAVVYQDWLKAATGMKPQLIDLTQPSLTPRLLSKNALINIPHNLCRPANNTGALVGGAADSGIFRNTNIYEIGLAYYNKRIDYECNVVPYDYFLAILSANDLISATMTNTDATNNCAWEFMRAAAGGTHDAPWEYTNAVENAASEVPRQFSINDYELRFYYRLYGSTEWLPIEAFDAADFWFGVRTSGTTIGVAPQGRPVGGYAGGFNDYSPLPKQRYICTLNFNQRAFWFSEKGLQFSLQNNVYAYPTRNAFNIPTGVCRGGIVHIQPGDVEQRSRLIIFGSDQCYAARFTGVKAQQEVRVSAETVGQFDVDGSDFSIDYLCDATAYSYRAAAVAEGILYFWGTLGVYRDDGLDKPVKISKDLEDEIFNYVDMGRIDEVHAVYNKRTKEVIWFYPPKEADADYPTHGLIYNTATDKFYRDKWRCQIDSAQNIKLESDDTPDGIDGERLLVHARASSSATVSRSFFLDSLCKSGEQGPGRELLCKTVSTPATGQRRLTMAAGHVALTSIVANDYVALQNVVGYAPSGLPTANDFLAKVIAVNNGSSYIDIELPTGAVLPNATLTLPEAFPVYHAGHDRYTLTQGLHGITWNIQTNYWMPGGVSEFWEWLYLYLLSKFSAWPAPVDLQGRKVGTGLTLGYRTLNCEGEIADTIYLRDCSESALSGQSQIHHPLRNQGVASVGQALKYRLLGVHLGHEWTLEYLEAHCVPSKGFGLKEFEG